MRCTCQSCGEYMVQDEKGLFSRCICPNCFQTCSACLGTQQKPLSREALSALMADRARYDRACAPIDEITGVTDVAADAQERRLGD